jgi:nucleoside-diphosphate-sugar epimerase
MSSALTNAPLRILVTGATGYIGGSVLDHLLAHPKRSSFEIVSFARDAEKAQKLEAQFGVKTVLGSLDDVQKIEDAAAEADVVINMASSDHLPAAQAMLRGLKRRHEATGKTPAFIHTVCALHHALALAADPFLQSGTAQLIDNSVGTYSEHIKYDDTEVGPIQAVSKDAIHRTVDLEVVAADHEGEQSVPVHEDVSSNVSTGYVRTYIVLPGAIYGLASGPVFSAGLAHRQSAPIPWIIKASLARGTVGGFGEGTNVWPYVHIDDTASLYVALLDALVANPERPGHGWEGFYFGEAGSLRAGDLTATIAKVLAQQGKVQKAEVIPWTEEDIAKYFYGVRRLLCIALAHRD